MAQPDAVGDPLGSSRVTLIGNVLPVPEAEVAEARELYLARYADSKYWVDFDDFSFYRMNVVDVYYVGGFGVMGWVAAPEYYSSQPDPLADSATGIIEHMNADHRDALILLARAFAGIEAQEATMTSVDRPGVSCTSENPRRHARSPYRVSSGSEHSSTSQRSSGRYDGAGPSNRVTLLIPARMNAKR